MSATFIPDYCYFTACRAVVTPNNKHTETLSSTMIQSTHSLTPVAVHVHALRVHVCVVLAIRTAQHVATPTISQFLELL